MLPDLAVLAQHMTCSARRVRAGLVGAFAVFAMMLAGPALLAQAADTLVDLGTLPGGIYSFPGGINAGGQVAGGADTSDGVIFRAFVWDSTGGMQNIGGLGGNAYGTALNAAGEVVGYSALAQTGGLRFTDHAFRWTLGGGMQDLGTLPGGSISRAYGVNGSGQIVGESSTMDSGVFAFRPFLWTPGGVMQSLGTLPGGGWGVAHGVNDAGQVVGQVNDAGGNTRAFLWTSGGGMQDLGALAGGAVSVARGINGLGQVVGWSEVTGGARHAFVWDPVGGMRDLGTLPGGAESQAYGINDAGQVVGGSSVAGGAIHAVLWEPDGAARDLGVLPGGSFSVAYGINASLQVVGQATAADGNDHAVRWQLNRAPVADALSVSTPQDTAVAFAVTGSDPDGDALSWTLLTGPAHGTLSGSLPGVTYTPTSGYSGPDSFTFRVSDGVAVSALATVSVTVTPVVSPPPAGSPPPSDPPGGADLDGRMKGQGFINADGKRHGFEFRVRTAEAGEERYGRVEYRVWVLGPRGEEERSAPQVGRFVSSAVTGATFTDAPSVRPGRQPNPVVDSVVFSGLGRWNDAPGYTFEVRATDAGEPGARRDSFAMTITSPGGQVVASVSGLLTGGNIQSKQLKP